MLRRPTTRGMGRLKQHRAAERDAHRHPAHRHSSDASRPGRRLQQSRCTASGASAKRTRRCASAFIHVDRGQTRATKVSPAAARHDARTSAGSGRGDRAARRRAGGASQGLRSRRRAERWHAPAGPSSGGRAAGGRRRRGRTREVRRAASAAAEAQNCRAAPGAEGTGAAGGGVTDTVAYKFTMIFALLYFRVTRQL